jgi:hypothetical protein
MSECWLPLTDLGDVTRYPGVGSAHHRLSDPATVVVVPKAYGVLCDAAGFSARLDALVDASGSSPDMAGVAFKFTFTLAPLIDPITWGALAADLAALTPARSGVLAPGVDSRSSVTMLGGTGITATCADAPGAGNLLLECLVNDRGDVPAISFADFFLADVLSTSTVAIGGSVGIRLGDDGDASSVTAALAVNAHRTAFSGNVSGTVFGYQGTVKNVGALSVRILRMCGYSAGGAVSEADLGGQPPTLDPGASVSRTMLFGASGFLDSVQVAQELVLPAGYDRSFVLRLIPLYAQTATDLTHRITVNGTALDLGAVAVVRVHITIDSLPSVLVPPLVLSTASPIVIVSLTIPVAALAAGLASTVQLVSVLPGGNTVASAPFGHDFLSSPILILDPMNL